MLRLTMALVALGMALAACHPADAAKAGGFHVVKRMEIGGEGGWDYLIYDSHRLYISRGTHVIVVDPARGTVVADIANTPGVHGIAIAPKLHRGFISCGNESSVVVFDTRTNKEIDRVKVGLGPDAIIFDPASNRVFTFNGIGGDSTAVDAATSKIVGSVKLDGRPEFAVADGKGGVYCNIEDKSEISRIDARTLTVKATWSIAPGDSPSGLAIDREHRRLFSVCRNGMMAVLDADSGKVIATPKIGEGPDAAGYDPGIGCAFSSNGDGTLTVVHESDPNTYEVQENATTEPGARTMAVDPSTHTVYVVTAKPDPTPPPAGAPRRRRRFLPNTFVVLAVKR